MSKPSGLGERVGLPPLRGQWPLLGATLIDAVGTGVFLPVSVLFFTVTTPLSVAQVGLGLGVASAMSLPLGPLFGALTDRWGARTVVVLSNLLQVLGFAGYLAVGSLPALTTTSLVVRAGIRAFWVSSGPLVTAIAAPEHRQRWFGLVGAARKVGYGIGGLLAGLLITGNGSGGYRAVVLANVASFAVAALLLLRLRVASRLRVTAVAGGWRAVLADRPFLALSVLNIAFALVDSALDIVLPVYLVRDLHLPAWTAGASFTLNTVLIVLAQSPVVALVEQRSRTRLLQLAGLLAAGCAGAFLLAGCLPAAGTLAMIAAGVVLFTASELLTSPVMGVLSNEAAPPALRGRYISVFQVSWTVATTVGLVVLTALLSAAPDAAWVFLAGVALLGSLGAGAVAPRLGHRQIAPDSVP